MRERPPQLQAHSHPLDALGSCLLPRAGLATLGSSGYRVSFPGLSLKPKGNVGSIILRCQTETRSDALRDMKKTLQLGFSLSSL